MRVKLSKSPPTRTYCKRNRPLPYCTQNCRTPLHWKFTQHHRTTRPPHSLIGPLSPNQPTNQPNLCIITEDKMKTENGGIFHPLPYTKLTEYFHWLQKFILSDNDYESIRDKNRTLRKKQNCGIFYPLNA